MSLGSQPVAYLDSPKPVVIWSDATFAGVLDFYPLFTTSLLCAETIRDGIANERAALERCALAIYSSDWAARTAIEEYGLDPAKVKVVPFGANHNANPDLKEVNTILQSRSDSTCKLLFLARDWHRKGGDTALATTQYLREGGLKAELWVIGCRPAINEPFPEYLKWWSYIDRSSPEGARKLDELIQECHFLILPTKADCTPTVVPEANCFGVPCLTTDVGGLPTIVKDGVNGRTFPLDAEVQDYAAYIGQLLADTARYTSMALTSFEEYRTRQNWRVASGDVVKLIEAIL